MEFVPLLMVGMKRYWFVPKRIVVRYTNQYCFALIQYWVEVRTHIALHSFLYWRRLPIVPPSIYCAKASYAQSHDIPLRSDTQALRLIARIPLIQRRKKCYSREDKSAFTQWYSSIYARSLKDQVRKSKYPRTQILEPCTQSKLISHSSTTFIHTRSNNLIQVSS